MAVLSNEFGRTRVVDRVAVITLDQPNSAVNTIGLESGPAFMSLIKGAVDDPSVDSIVLMSGKKDSFIAGADIEMLNGRGEAEAASMSREFQDKIQELRKSPKPIVAAIHGTCYGGGLEMALGCQYRVCTEHPKTVMGLPEVKLGILPGGMGTYHLIKQVGLPSALPLCLTGSDVRPNKAKKLRLVDQVCDPNALETAAVQAAQALGAKKLKPSAPKLGFVDKVVTQFGPARNFALKKARESTQKVAGDNYPAPFAIIDVISNYLERGVESGRDAEAKAFGKLAVGSESLSLRSIFFGEREVGKARFGAPPIPVAEQKVAMIGAGLMGAGIAQVSAQKAGCETVLYDVDDAGINRGMKQIYESVDQRVKKRIDSFATRDRTMSRLLPVSSTHPRLAEHLKNVSLVIEAVPEKLELKHKVLRNIESMVPEHCIIASNTSALPIADIAAGLARPERVVGMHYFSPVDKMPLLEIIVTDKTSREATATAFAVGKAQGKRCIVVKDSPGFYTTRILAAFMPEIGPLLAEGVDPLRIDKVLRKWGFPVGPLTLIDEVGIDVGLHIDRFLKKEFGARMGPDNAKDMLEAFVSKGNLGRKSKKGFFVYDDDPKKAKQSGGKRLNPDATQVIQQLQQGQKFVERTDQEIQERMALRMVNEAIYCLEEEVLSSPVDGDIGAVFGLGFPPFRGGPFQYVDQTGADKVLDTLNRLVDQYGPRFQPSEMLKSYAKNGKKFRA